MLILETIENIVEYKDLSEEYRENLWYYFENQGTDKIVHMEDNQYCTYEQLIHGKEPADIRVEYICSHIVTI